MRVVVVVQPVVEELLPDGEEEPERGNQCDEVWPAGREELWHSTVCSQKSELTKNRGPSQDKCPGDPCGHRGILQIPKLLALISAF